MNSGTSKHFSQGADRYFSAPFPLVFYRMNDLGKIEVHLPFNAARKICPLLFQKGVLLKVQTGASIKNFLREQISLDKTYVDKRISTIFLNGQPVDDIDKTIIRNNDTLALSGAMPGIIGATMRRDSYLALLRNTITFKEYGNDAIQDRGLIRFKLFNFISQEIGPLLLQRGLMINSKDVINLFQDKMSEEVNEYSAIFLDGEKAGLKELRKILKSSVKQELILLKFKIS